MSDRTPIADVLKPLCDRLGVPYRDVTRLEITPREVVISYLVRSDGLVRTRQDSIPVDTHEDA